MSRRNLYAAIWLMLGIIVSSGASAEDRSFRTVNQSGEFFIRHQNMVGFITPITNEDNLGRSDATFWVVPGLTGECHSLEAVKPRGFFLRHQDFRIVLAEFTDISDFRKDATFCLREPGLTGGDGTVSFESVNFPNFYIRHFNFQLFLNKLDDSGSFKQDATFSNIAPLTRNLPHHEL